LLIIPDTILNFEFFCFLDPTDVKSYFLINDERDITSRINNYFAHKYESDGDFRDFYTVNGNGEHIQKIK
jgi:hypothetical protein